MFNYTIKFFTKINNTFIGIKYFLFCLKSNSCTNFGKINRINIVYGHILPENTLRASFIRIKYNKKYSWV